MLSREVAKADLAAFAARTRKIRSKLFMIDERQGTKNGQPMSG